MAKKNDKSSAPAVVMSKEIRLNSDLVGFIAEVIAQKIASEGNAEQIRELYQSQIGRASCRERV